MSEREIEMAIMAVETALHETTPVPTSEQRRDLYGALDALKMELRQMRARKPVRTE